MTKSEQSEGIAVSEPKGRVGFRRKCEVSEVSVISVTSHHPHATATWR